MWRGRWYFTSLEDPSPGELQANKAYLNLAKLQYADQGNYTWYNTLYSIVHALFTVHFSHEDRVELRQ